MLYRRQSGLTHHYLRTLVSVPGILIALLFAGPVFSDTGKPQAVIKMNSSKVYVYTEEGDEADPNTMKAKAFKKHFSDLGLDGLDQEGLLIVDSNVAEGLIAVELPGEVAPIWIELIAVEVWPGNKLQCPDTVVGQSKETDQGVTIGFGEHCE